MNSNRAAMVDVESNLSAAAEEERARIPVETKSAAAKMVAEVDSEEDESSFCSLDPGYIISTATEVPKKPSGKLAARSPVETKLSDKMEGIAKMIAEYSDELGPDRSFAAQAICFRDRWNAMYSRCYGHFEDTTKIPNMRFTYKKPTLDEFPVPTATLQIFSLKVAKIWGGLQWPLHVFGKVAIRDVVDHNRNMIFQRPRESCQIVTQEDPYLKLTGPTRAVVLVDPVTFEVDLQVKGITQDEDKRLSFLAVTYHDMAFFRSRLVKRDYASMLSRVEFELGSIVSSVEATISLQVRPGSGSWPDGFRARISARTASIASIDKPDEPKVMLLDSGDDEVSVSCSGSISLSRCVASVEIFGQLEVCVKAGRGEEIVVDMKKFFNPKKDGASHRKFCLGFCTLDVTVSWSLVSSFVSTRR